MIQMKDDNKLVNYAAACAGYLGRMYLRGEGVKQDITIGRMWFERGAAHGERESHNGLGIIYRDGLGVKTNMKTAYTHFLNAAGQDLAEAQINLGKHHYCEGLLSLISQNHI
jgi:SEL1 protein